VKLHPDRLSALQAVTALGAFAPPNFRRYGQKLKLDADATIETDTDGLHRPVRHVAAARIANDTRERVRRAQVEVVAAVYME